MGYLIKAFFYTISMKNYFILRVCLTVILETLEMFLTFVILERFFFLHVLEMLKVLLRITFNRTLNY